MSSSEINPQSALYPLEFGRVKEGNLFYCHHMGGSADSVCSSYKKVRVQYHRFRQINSFLMGGEGLEPIGTWFNDDDIVYVYSDGHN